MSIASTYLLAIVAIVAIAVILGLIGCITIGLTTTLKNMAMFVYCFFIGGLSFAAAAGTQGAFLNFNN